MITIKWSLNEAIAKAQTVVAQKGKDYVYPYVEDGCEYYMTDGSASCFLGHMFSLEDEAVAIRDAIVPYSMNHAGVGYFWDPIYQVSMAPVVNGAVIEVDPVTKVFLEALQEYQDMGKTWGNSLADALEKAQDYAEAQGLVFDLSDPDEDEECDEDVPLPAASASTA